MLAFATIFLGLVLGVQPVTVVVGDQVARVELLLNGGPVATVEGEPWTAECDFGNDLVPQTLEAVAYDADGREVERARQRINLPSGLAEARIVLETGEDSAFSSARVVFDSVLRTAPENGTVLFDGRPLEVDDPLLFELPNYDPDRIHHLSVELEFPDNVRTPAEITFGGEFADAVSTPQTAVPIVAKRGRKPKQPIDLSGSFERDGEPLRVLAVDEGPAEVVIVRDLTAQKTLDRLAAEMRLRLLAQARGSSSGANPLQAPNSIQQVYLRFVARLKKDQMVWLLEPFSEKPGGFGYELETFPFSPHMSSRDGGLPFLLTTIRPPANLVSEQRLADAVAVAGRGVAQRDRRRAVVLILGEGLDFGSLTPAVARKYLRTVHVPLVVWSTEEVSAETRKLWGDVREVTTSTQLERATKELSQLLDRQRIVWLEGLHLPQQISLADGKGRLQFPM